MRAAGELRGPITATAIVSLAVLIQGMVIWRLLPSEALAGARGLLVGVVVIVSHGLLAAWRRPVAPRRSALVVLSLLAALAYVGFGLARHENHAYGLWKAQGFALFAVMPAAAIAWNLAGRPELIRRLLTVMLVLSFAPFLLPVLLVERFGSGPLRWLLTTLDLDVIGLGRSLGVGALLCVCAMAGRRRSVAFLLLVMGVLMLAAQVLVGERGPVLALLVGVLVYVVLMRRQGHPAAGDRAVRVVTVALGVLVILSAVAYLFHARGETGHEERRLAIAREGWDRWLDDPLLGVGLGRFTYDPGLDSDRQFFHNLIGEVTVELGLVGLLVCGLFFWVANAGGDRGPPAGERRQLRVTIMALLAFAVAAAMVSGDLATNSLVWIAQALFFAASQDPEGDAA